MGGPRRAGAGGLAAGELPIETIACDGDEGDVAEQLKALYDPRHFRIDVRRRRCCADSRPTTPRTVGGCCCSLVHHLAVDHTTLELLLQETQWIAQGE